MKNLNWRKISRFYVWIILLTLAAVVFILLRSPAAGQRQASQDLSELNVSGIDNESQSPSQLPASAEAAKKSETSQSSSSATMPVPPADDGSLVPLPEPLPAPWTYTKPPFCPLFSEGVGSYIWRCSPCGPYPYMPTTESEIVCIE
ncbi:MAG TPA: hypothetical protein VIK37_01270 [Candidatus Saccharimonadales bacterium]